MLINRMKKLFYNSFIAKKMDKYRINNLNDIYPEEYFSRRLYGDWYEDIQNISKIIFNKYTPESVADLGCGSGAYLKEMKKYGVNKIQGVDGSKSALKQAVIKEIILHDLRHPIEDIGRYDLVICFEVAEHLHERYADILVNNITNACEPNGRVIFSAALPGQKGEHHINLKPKDYWEKKFEKKGFFYLDLETQLLINTISKKIQKITWLPNNIMVFKR